VKFQVEKNFEAQAGNLFNDCGAFRGEKLAPDFQNGCRALQAARH
jgi:hypothetical protein